MPLRENLKSEGRLQSHYRSEMTKIPDIKLQIGEPALYYQVKVGTSLILDEFAVILRVFSHL